MTRSTTILPGPTGNWPGPSTPPSRGGRIRKIVKRTLLSLLALLVAFIGSGIVLQATGAVPESGATPTVAPASAEPVASVAPSAVASVPTAAPVGAQPVPAAVAPASAAPQQPVVRQPVAQKPAAPKPVVQAPAPKKAVAPQPVVKAPAKAPAQAAPKPATVSYANCTAVKAAGAAPILRGQPGYSSKLDRDGDGIACET